MIVLQLLFNAFLKSLAEIQEDLLKLSRLRSGTVTVNTVQRELDLLQRLLGIIDTLVSGIKERQVALTKVLEARKIAKEGQYELARTTVTEATELFPEYDPERAIEEVNEFIDACERGLASSLEGFNRMMAPFNEFVGDEPNWANFQNANWAALEERCVTLEQVAPRNADVISARSRLAGRRDQWARELLRRWKAMWGHGPYYSVPTYEAYYVWKSFVGDEAATEETTVFNKWNQDRQNARTEQVNAFYAAREDFDYAGMCGAIDVLAGEMRVDEVELPELHTMRQQLTEEARRIRDLELQVGVFAHHEATRNLGGLQNCYKMFADLPPKALGGINLEELMGRMRTLERRHLTFEKAVGHVTDKKVWEAERLIADLEQHDLGYPGLAELHDALNAVKAKKKGPYEGLLVAYVLMYLRLGHYPSAQKKINALQKHFPANAKLPELIISYNAGVKNPAKAIKMPSAPATV
jgi:hypothetical protein